MNHQAAAEAIRQLQREKADRIARERLEEEQRLQQQEELARHQLDKIAEDRRQLAQRTAKDRVSLEALDKQAANEWQAAAEERLRDELQRRVFELQGNPNEAVRERLIKEGFAEGVVIEELRKRTLEQTLERSGGLRAQFVESDNPLERLTRDFVTPADLQHREVLNALENLREGAVMKGYLTPLERDQVDRALYFTEKFEQNEFYRQSDPHQYFSRVKDVAGDIRRELGLDENAARMSYHNKGP